MASTLNPNQQSAYRKCSRSQCSREAADPKYKMCAGCREYANALNQRDPEKAKLRWRRSWFKKYGMTPEDYDKMFESQNGKCALCERKEEAGQQRCLAVDHDHLTGVVRGLLCHHCNVALGHFDDNPERLAAAIAYLERAA